MFLLIAVCLIKLDNFSVDISSSANVSVNSSLAYQLHSWTMFLVTAVGLVSRQSSLEDSLSEKWMDSVSVDSSLLHLGQLVNISVDNSSSEAR